MTLVISKREHVGLGRRLKVQVVDEVGRLVSVKAALRFIRVEVGIFVLLVVNGDSISV